MNEEELKKLALQIARNAFKDKLDLAGRPYIEHLKRVAENSHSTKYIPAILHDLLEDCPEWNEDSLRDIFSNDDVLTILTLTKGKDEDYEDYINRVSENWKAKEIKIADLKDNLDITRLNILDENNFKRLQKYHKALKKLQS
jgi:(p)ppGpp synthase/HD superfamily hydrolase